LKKICFVIPSLHPGGMERVMSELINSFSKKENVEIHLILYGIKRDVFYKIPLNIFIHRPNFVFNNKKRIWSTIKTLFFLRKKIKQLNPSTILSFGELWNSFVLISLIGIKLPIFVSDRCQPDKSWGFVQDILSKLLYKNARGIIAQTNKAKDIYIKKYKHPNIKVIGNPIRKIENEAQLQKERIVLSVGRLITSKHHDELIKLFVKIGKSGWKLVIVGDDAIKQNNMVKLRQLVSDLKADDKVILAGNQKDVDSYYLKSEIFAFTSSSEGFPNVIGEAQSAGLPVVAFDCVAGPADLVQNEYNGYLIPLYNYSLFENKLNLLMCDDKLRNSLGNKAKISVKIFEAEIISNIYFNFITAK
jgi:GalNAc-alpha-(1->4)-GalNAc-alpha-(1->3)-diNAcBac-PP-undecaprenol alpha-1,4-N-acetyl-D-galactosaminyltransferase